MKITTLLLATSTVSLAAFFAALFVNRDGLLAGGLFSILLVGLIALRDYRTRSYYVVTAGVSERRRTAAAAPALPGRSVGAVALAG